MSDHAATHMMSPEELPLGQTDDNKDVEAQAGKSCSFQKQKD